MVKQEWICIGNTLRSLEVFNIRVQGEVGELSDLFMEALKEYTNKRKVRFRNLEFTKVAEKEE